MPNYSLALGVQNPQIDVARQFALASQMRRDQIAEQAAALQARVTQHSLGRAQGQENALAAYNAAVQKGDPNAINALAAYPEQQSQVLAVRQRLSEVQQAEFDQRILRNARRAQRVAGLQGSERAAAWKEELKAARESGDLSPEMYDRLSKAPVNDLMLHNLMRSGLDIEKQLEIASGRVVPVGSELVRVYDDGRAPEKVYSAPKSRFDEALADMLTGGSATTGVPASSPATRGAPQQQQRGEAAPPSGVQLQSGEAAPLDPANIRRVADVQPAADGISAPATPDPDQDIVDTPFGRMTRNEARRRSFALALSGRGDAGKMLLEETNLSPVARNEIDKKELNATEYLSRLKNIEDQMDPKFLTIENKVKNWGVSLVDSFETLRGKLKPEQLAELAKFTTFKQSALENINSYIKEITGAQMSEAEAGRIRRAAPDPDNDGPTQFIAKLKNAVNAARMAVVRYRYLRKNGFQGQPWDGTAEDAAAKIPLGKMQDILDETAKRIYQQLKQANPKADEAAIRGATRSQLSAEIGLTL